MENVEAAYMLLSTIVFYYVGMIFGIRHDEFEKDTALRGIGRMEYLVAWFAVVLTFQILQVPIILLGLQNEYLAIGFAACVSGYLLGVAGRLRCADAFGNYNYLWALLVPIVSLYFIFAPPRPNASETRFAKVPFFNGLGGLLTLVLLAVTAALFSVLNSVLLEVI